MPIKDVSTARRLPRLGIIRLGIKVEETGKSPYPRATDYFVVPDELKKTTGEKPKELQIMFPSNDMEQVAPQYLRCYGRTHGLVCWGDGEQSKWKVDLKTGALAGRETKDWKWTEDGTCDPQTCPEYGARCRRVMNLMFFLPDAPGLGVWQINTTSFYSIREVNSTLDLIRNLTRSPEEPDGRISFIPLTLVLGPYNVNPPGTGQKTVHIMRLKSDVKLSDVIRRAMLPPARVIVPTPEVEEAPEDLFPAEVIENHPELVAGREPEQPFPGLDEERQAEWEAITKLMGQVNVNERGARSFFANVHDVSIPHEELAKETVPPALTVYLLRDFRKRLEESRMKL